MKKRTENLHGGRSLDCCISWTEPLLTCLPLNFSPLSPAHLKRDLSSSDPACFFFIHLIPSHRIFTSHAILLLSLTYTRPLDKPRPDMQPPFLTIRCLATRLSTYLSTHFLVTPPLHTSAISIHPPKRELVYRKHSLLSNLYISARIMTEYNEYVATTGSDVTWRA